MKSNVYPLAFLHKPLLAAGAAGHLLVALLLVPAHAQKLSSPALAQTASAADDADDVDVDLSNYPVPVRYAHGSVNGQVSQSLPMPKDPTVRKRYVQAQDLRDKGFAYLAYRRYTKAIARLNQSLALWPDNAQTYRWLAEAYEANGQTPQAIADYRLLFYGWPGRVRSGQPERNNDQVPADKPRDYDQATPAETDPTLLMRFSLLLQQTGQYAEARRAYERGMELLAPKFAGDALPLPLPPLSAAALVTPADLEAAARTALAIDQVSYQDKRDAEDNLERALQLRPDSPTIQLRLARLKAGG